MENGISTRWVLRRKPTEKSPGEYYGRFDFCELRDAKVFRNYRAARKVLDRIPYRHYSVEVVELVEVTRGASVAGRTLIIVDGIKPTEQEAAA